MPVKHVGRSTDADTAGEEIGLAGEFGAIWRRAHRQVTVQPDRHAGCVRGCPRGVELRACQPLHKHLELDPRRRNAGMQRARLKPGVIREQRAALLHKGAKFTLALHIGARGLQAEILVHLFKHRKL